MTLITNSVFITLIFFVVILVGFIANIFRRMTKLVDMHKCYVIICSLLIIWFSVLISMRYIYFNNMNLLYIFDSICAMCAALLPIFALLFVISFITESEKEILKKYWSLFIMPFISFIMIYTNDYHNLYYQKFSLFSSEVEFGPYFYIHSVYTFSCAAIALFLILRFAFKSKIKIHIKQAIYYAIGLAIPCVMNIILVTGIIEASILITPIFFMVTIITHGLAIFKLGIFDIKPIAMQHLINMFSDCFLVTDKAGMILNYNQPFLNLFGNRYKIRENTLLNDCVKEEDIENKTAIYNLLTAIGSCPQINSKITYEQSISVKHNEDTVINYYIVEVSPVLNYNEICGYLSIFKDITQIKLNLQRIQDSQVKLMERERLAFLGQMVGGLAHNLKTPIMSISGSLSAVENLIQESRESMDDPQVTKDDFIEIYGDMDEWVQKMRIACAYMSDIINAVKGQARNMNVSDGTDFTVDETIKRVALLLRHELQSSNCDLQVIYTPVLEEYDIYLHGDINNLVQVLNNLISNSIDAQVEYGNHTITVEVNKNETSMVILVKDNGCGISANVQKELFKQMVTNKGNMGTGLGVFISNSVIHAKFDGSMWFNNNPSGGTIFGISIPLENVVFKAKK